MTREATCEERIDAQLEGRLAHIDALQQMISAGQQGDGEKLREVLQDSHAQDLAEVNGWAVSDAIAQPENAAEDLERALDELPLGVSSYRVFRVDLSTGGPGDWIEFTCSGDTPAYEPAGEHYAIERISYHFNDWFDHAERNVGPSEPGWEVLADFATRVVPELAG